MVKRKKISTNEEKAVKSVKPIEKELKLCVKIKNCIKSNSQSNLSQSKNKSTPLKLPLVKYQQATDLVNSFSNENALPARCKFDNESTLLDKLKRNGKTCMEVVKTKRNLWDECNINNDDKRLQDKIILENKNSNALNKKKVPLKKKSTVAKGDINPKFIHPSKESNQNQLGSSYPGAIRRCKVRLRRISTTKKTDVLEKHPISSTIKGCVIEMQSTQSGKQAIQAPTSAIIKNCVVKLPKISNSNKNTGNYESNEPGSSNFTYSVPVIDSNIRHNFHKLSLSKTSGKFPDNNEIGNVSKLNLIDDRGTQESIKSYITEASEVVTANSEVNQLNTQETILKSSDLRRIKHLPKLSLKRKTVVTNKSMTNSELNQLKPQQNSSVCFEPVRNSTLLELTPTKDKPQENPKEETGKILLLKNKSSSQNLANKSEEIENLLNSLDKEDEVPLSSVETKNKIDCMFVGNNQDNNFPNFSNKTKKFYHYKKDGDILKESSVRNTKSLKRQKVKQKQRSCSTRSSVLQDDIYEFLSQSQTSDSDIAKHVDPTADIIQKLITQGKVRLATAYKGKGKPKFKSAKSSKKKIKTAKSNTNAMSKPFDPKRKKVAFTEEKQDYAYEDHFTDHYENDNVNNEPAYGIDKQERYVACNNFRNNSFTNYTNNQEGMFSNLARSILMKQVRGTDAKFVSTPKNNTLFSLKTTLDRDLSPIAMAPPRPATVASPWRINEDAHLPKTFSFSTSSANLPSFSCDFIPSTPKKVEQKICINKSPIKSNQHLVSSTPAISSHLRNDIENTQPQTQNIHDPSVLFSFSLNDSNAENIPPPTHTSEKSNKNDCIFNSKSRKVFNNRSSLKDINILEVVHLPPYVHPKKTTNRNAVVKRQTDMLNFENNLGNLPFQWDNTIQQGNASGKTENDPKEDLFGFEEFLSQTEYSSQEDCKTIDNDAMIKHIKNQSLHDKLQNIRKLKPCEDELQNSLLKENSENCTKAISLFDDKAANKQRGINEMLCSTMLNARPSTIKDTSRMLNNTNMKDPIISNFHKDLELSTLFIDAEPETTFNENDAHRTYIRPHKRKRRLRENNYVAFLETDESEDDSPRKQKNYQQNREMEHNTRKKRITKDCNENQELINFVEEFKKTCQEVDCYELIIEKSTQRME